MQDRVQWVTNVTFLASNQIQDWVCGRVQPKRRVRCNQVMYYAVRVGHWFFAQSMRSSSSRRDGGLNMIHRALIIYPLLALPIGCIQPPIHVPPSKIQQIKNVIVIVQENRTPDNLFHYLTPACPLPAKADVLHACIPANVSNSCYDISPCGISNRSGSPQVVTLTPTPLETTVDPDHTHWSFMAMCDPDPVTLNCRNDGAWNTTDPPGEAYAYVENISVTNSDGSHGYLLDPYLTLAKQYGWANFMYQTNQGGSYTAHQFIFSGTSAMTAEGDANSTFIAENFL